MGIYPCHSIKTLSRSFKRNAFDIQKVRNMKRETMKHETIEKCMYYKRGITMFALYYILIVCVSKFTVNFTMFLGSFLICYLFYIFIYYNIYLLYIIKQRNTRRQEEN